MIERRTLVPRQRNIYSAFPTFTEYRDRIYIFYRQGVTSARQCHGVDGTVRCLQLDKGEFLERMHHETEEGFLDAGEEEVVFRSENEIDAIVSRLDEDLFTLCTRIYMRGRICSAFISVADEPRFSKRRAVELKGVEWIVFYGKAVKSPAGFIFPAYGILKGEEFTRPLVIVTDDFEHWDLLAYLPSGIDGAILNESTVVFDGNRYRMFSRQDSSPFGIWLAESEDLQRWSTPCRILSRAHAPMAVTLPGGIALTYRELLSKEKSAVALRFLRSGESLGRETDHADGFSVDGDCPDELALSLTIDYYEGNPYDGGYTDLGLVDDDLVIVYYHGNEEGEPSIRAAALPWRELDGRIDAERDRK
ncbi:hypothetical protein HM1_1747 [Heliomicrobium modesticaldum Ice1]|uniref:Glycosidase n=1 Tax=Heliobacterium modesticaldum (strain ATCC 51547 / Ice1) TaxID=498761 RepID=B0TER5_HELMI|nr:sialidase family protein [Heliomicrobium modesticaldum]ABZ84317.1 hypothetical protein HM1_1747 [Heliomicrobium modesticaldum Ice1]